MPHTVRWKWRDTGEPVDVPLEDHEYAWLRGQYERVKDMPPSAERTTILTETCVFMELHAAFPGSALMTPEQQAEWDAAWAEAKRGLPPEVKSLEERGFKIPDAAKAAMAGQLFEPPPPRRERPD